jgi:hypothetical protein
MSMVRLKLAETNKIVWVDARQLSLGPVTCEPFQGILKDKIIEIQKTLSEVWPKTYAEWEDGFRRDANPEGEITWFLKLAQMYASYCAPETNPDRKKEIFNLFMNCSFATEKTVLFTAELKLLTKQEANAAIHYYYHGKHE